MRTILISAYACEPLKGSEQAVGWNFVLQLAKFNKVYVITRANNQKPIEENLPKELRNNIIFHYYDTANYIKRLKNKSKGIYLYYFFWQIGIIHVLMKLRDTIHFDYAIHLTFGNVWLPTFLPYFNIPFIWGPLGGGEGIPNSFINQLPIKQRIVQTFRRILKMTTYVNPFFIIPAMRSKIILCRTKDTADLFPTIFRKRIRLMEDGAIESDIFKYHTIHTKRDTVRIISTSRLIGFKNVICIIEALHFLPREYNVECVIIGDGPERERIKKSAQNLGDNHRVIFKRNMTRDEVLSDLSQSDIFISPSLRDACNLSLLEAMAVGMPVICLNWSGMALSTNDICAIRLPVTNPEQMPKDMALAIIKLIEHPELRKQMGDSGRKRIKVVFNWEAKGKFLENLFNELENKNKRFSSKQ